MEVKLSLGQLISARRRYLNMTQEELAKRIYVSKSAIAKWETDGGIPDRNNLYKLAEVIQVPIEDLYHVISGGKQPEVNLNINITTEIISLLESYGYRVTPPGKNYGEES